LKENDREAKAYIEAFLKRLAEFGWSQGSNLRIEYRHTGGNAVLVQQYAAELSVLALDVVLVAGGSHVGPLQQVTRTLPIVFVQVADAVGNGFVESLARPGGNATGFTNFEFDISGKWLELLKQIAPNMTRIAVLRDQRNPSGPNISCRPSIRSNSSSKTGAWLRTGQMQSTSIGGPPSTWTAS
jgi:putative ABC transport system substrate-binding protein